MKLRNAVFAGASYRAARQLAVQSTMERDGWFNFNMMSLIGAHQAHRVENPVFRNVADRLIRIASHRAERGTR